MEKTSFLQLTPAANSKLSRREKLIGLIIFAVIKHINGAHHNLRRESE